MARHKRGKTVIVTYCPTERHFQWLSHRGLATHKPRDPADLHRVANAIAQLERTRLAPRERLHLRILGEFAAFRGTQADYKSPVVGDEVDFDLGECA